MTRSRAQRLVEVARSKGIQATYHATAPSRPGASTPFLYYVILSNPEQPPPAWCFNTRSFFKTIRYFLDYQRASRS